jgi:hypothetical protein
MATPWCIQHRGVDQKNRIEGKKENVINMFSYRNYDIWTFLEQLFIFSLYE